MSPTARRFIQKTRKGSSEWRNIGEYLLQQTGANGILKASYLFEVPVLIFLNGVEQTYKKKPVTNVYSARKFSL
jgi:hypothetical protein